MRVQDSCAECLLKRQTARIQKTEYSQEKKEEYVAGVKAIIDHRAEDDCSPYLVSLFGKLYTKLFGRAADYTELKRGYNDLVLSMEKEIEEKICLEVSPELSEEEQKREHLLRSLVYARIGNYIDYGAMDVVDNSVFLKLFDDAVISEQDRSTFAQFYRECEQARKFLLITDNCGEIVLDKLFLRALKGCFPDLNVSILVRGEDVLNDATMADVSYVGLDLEGTPYSNGSGVAGTVYRMLPDDAKQVLDEADVILAKGQGNYESMSGEGRHVFYSFLCKCDLFTTRFGVPKLTGMFVSE